jgi:hypothetical protein
MMDTVPSSTAFTTSATAVGDWLAIYLLGSGTAPTATVLKHAARAAASNPFHTSITEMRLVFGANAADVSAYFYPSSVTATSIPVYDWLTASAWLYNIGYADMANVTTATATVEVVRSGSVVEDSTSFDLADWDEEYGTKFLSAAATKSAADFRASGWWPRYKLRIVKSAGPTATVGMAFGEPQLAFSHTPSPPPFSPQLARWGATTSDFSGAVSYTGVISPTQIAATTNDWNPTGLSTCNLIRLSTDATRSLTGLVAQPAGRRITLCNIGSQICTLVHDNGVNSTAANRFLVASSTSLNLNPNASVDIWYDLTSARWRVINP